MFDYLVQMWELATDGDKQGVLFFIALYTSVIMLGSVLHQLHVRTWPAARGRLLESGLKEFGFAAPHSSKQEYKVDAVYEYTVNGETYTGKRVSPWVVVASHNARFLLERQLAGVERLDGDGVRVFYNPARPAKSFLTKPGSVGLAFCIIVAVAPLPWYWFAYHG